MQMRFITVFAAVVTLASCNTATEPTSDVSAVVVQQTIVRSTEGSVDRVTATFRVAITNRSRLDVYYGGCGMALEQEGAANRWDFATAPTCSLVAPAHPTDGMLLIPAGTSREVGASMYADVDGTGWPSDGIAGTYRLRVTLLAPLPVAWRGMMGVQYRSESLFTNEFNVESN